MGWIGSFIGFYVIVYIILVVFFRGMRGMVYMALSGSVRGFNRSWMDLFTKRFTKLTEGVRWIVEGIRGCIRRIDGLHGISMVR